MEIQPGARCAAPGGVCRCDASAAGADRAGDAAAGGTGGQADAERRGAGAACAQREHGGGSGRLRGVAPDSGGAGGGIARPAAQHRWAAQGRLRAGEPADLRPGYPAAAGWAAEHAGSGENRRLRGPLGRAAYLYQPGHWGAGNRGPTAPGPHHAHRAGGGAAAWRLPASQRHRGSRDYRGDDRRAAEEAEPQIPHR